MSGGSSGGTAVLAQAPTATSGYLLGTNADPKAAMRKGDDLPQPDPHFAAVVDPATWIEQSFRAATMAVYVDPIGIGPALFTVDSTYEKRARAEMVALADARLANLLNDSLKTVVLGAHAHVDEHTLGARPRGWSSSTNIR